jgi:hypothetical protein
MQTYTKETIKQIAIKENLTLDDFHAYIRLYDDKKLNYFFSKQLSLNEYTLETYPEFEELLIL